MLTIAAIWKGCAMAVVREAVASDIPRLCDLLALLFTQEADFRPDRAKQEAGLRKIMADPVLGRILVLADDGDVVGMVNLLFTVSTAEGAKAAILEDMVIDPERRGRGDGERLLQSAIAFAKGMGCVRITLLTDRDNGRAIAFYQRHGFRLSEMIPLRLHVSREDGD